MTLPRIRLLDSFEINQISAGEVIERPASILKELADNALDAGATSLKILWRQGGQSLIQVQDNGCGMDSAQMSLALERHTTSKLPAGDLTQIRTYGFRGEALASIAASARVKMISRPQGQDHGWSLDIQGGIASAIEPVSSPYGTQVNVSDLFFATPARMKFLRSPSVEHGHLLDVTQRIALMSPDVTLSVHYETRTQVYPVGLDHRLGMILGQTFVSNAFEVSYAAQNCGVNGYAGLPTVHRRTPDHQFFFVNGRPVRDKILSSAVKAAYQDVMMVGRYPACVLYVHVPLEDVDVNVHPAKTEVRFRDPRWIRAMIVEGLRQALRQHGSKSIGMHQTGLDKRDMHPLALGTVSLHPVDLDSKTGLSLVQGPEETSFEQASHQGPEEARDAAALGPLLAKTSLHTKTDVCAHALVKEAADGNSFAQASAVVKEGDDLKGSHGVEGDYGLRENQGVEGNYAEGRDTNVVRGYSLGDEVSASHGVHKAFGAVSVSVSRGVPASSSLMAHESFDALPYFWAQGEPLTKGCGMVSARGDVEAVNGCAPLPLSSRLMDTQRAEDAVDLGSALFQIQDSYIVAQKPQGLVIVDPHAAHERIVYEAMKKDWGDSLGHVQDFLVGIPVALTLDLQVRYHMHQELLIRAGMHNSPCDEGCLLLSMPLIFQKHDPVQLLCDLLECAGLDQSDPHEILVRWRDHIMGNWACKKSIKLGQRLSLEEMNALLRTIEKTPHSAQCNHGRPVYCFLDIRALEALFARR